MTPRRILLVEDNHGDVLLTKRAFREYPVEFEVITNGEEALNRLLTYEQPLPELILLDLNLPRVSGWEILERVREERLLRRIPIIILTSSDAEADIGRSYELNASAYLQKPVTPDAFKQLANDFDAFWLGQVKLPSMRGRQ